MSDLRDKAGLTAAGEDPAADGLPRTAISDAIEAAVTRVGEWASLLWLLLMAVIVVQVAMRYILGQGSIMFEELQWHIYGVGFLLGLGYCLLADRHVRIDVLASGFAPRPRAWIELLGLLLFLLPFTAAVIVEGYELARRAWALNEVSVAPGGLGHRWVIKGMVVVGFAGLAAAAFARLARCSAFLFGFPKPIR